MMTALRLLVAPNGLPIRRNGGVGKTALAVKIGHRLTVHANAWPACAEVFVLPSPRPVLLVLKPPRHREREF
jgi:hypothetical protein